MANMMGAPPEAGGTSTVAPRTTGADVVWNRMPGGSSAMMSTRSPSRTSEKSDWAAKIGVERATLSAGMLEAMELALSTVTVGVTAGAVAFLTSAAAPGTTQLA